MSKKTASCFCVYARPIVSPQNTESSSSPASPPSCVRPIGLASPTNRDKFIAGLYVQSIGCCLDACTAAPNTRLHFKGTSVDVEAGQDFGEAGDCNACRRFIANTSLSSLKFRLQRLIYAEMMLLPHVYQSSALVVWSNLLLPAHQQSRFGCSAAASRQKEHFTLAVALVKVRKRKGTSCDCFAIACFESKQAMFEPCPRSMCPQRPQTLPASVLLERSSRHPALRSD
jgi:hypothetical protein